MKEMKPDEKNINEILAKKDDRTNRRKNITIITLAVALVVLIPMCILVTYFVGRPSTNTTISDSPTVEEMFPYMNTSLYYSASGDCTATNLGWVYGTCKTGFPALWSVGLNGANKYMIFRFYNDESCNSPLANISIMLSSGCVNNNQIKNRILVNYTAVKYCQSLDVC
jgi:hypothetical protein